ncbi:MAG: hypothetical protein JSV36_22015, partial [Anaerolineae bacterium]
MSTGNELFRLVLLPVFLLGAASLATCTPRTPTPAPQPSATPTAEATPTPTPVLPGVESSIRYVYIVPMSHLDIGFSAPPDVVAEGYKANLDLALSYLERFPDLVWNVEELWQLEQWLRRTPDEARVQEAVALIKAGRLGLSAGYANMHTGLMSAAEMHHFLYPAESFRQRYGVQLQVAVQNDVPGFSWALPQVLARAGVRYLVAGPNTGPSGGGASIPRQDNPFFWEGSDGSRVLTWMSPDSYAEGLFTFQFNKDFNEVLLAEDLARYTASGYPHDAILVQYAFDNWDADQLGLIQLLLNVREWNRTRANPRFILATPEAFFQHMEARYGSEFSIYRGDWSGLWEQVKVLSPAGIAMVRRAKSSLLVGEGLATLNALLAGVAYPSSEVDGLYRDLLDYDEHSVGSIVPWPGLLTEEEINHDNATRYRQAKGLDEGSRALLERQWGDLARRLGGTGPAIVVFNPLSWARTGVASLTLPEEVRCPCVLRDEESGEIVPVEQMEGGQLLFLAPQVPALGYRRFSLEPVGSSPQVTEALEVWATGMENAFFRLEVDPQSGHLASLWDKGRDGELVRADDALPFNGLLWASHKSTYSDGQYGLISSAGVTVTAAAGPVAGRLAIEREGTPFVRPVITLYAGLPWLEWTNVLDRSQMREVPAAEHSDLYFFSFPLALAPQGLRLHLETPGGFLDPAVDLLPGANGRGFSVQRVTALEGEDGYAVLLSTGQAFLVFAGDVTRTGTYLPPESATLLSGAMGVAHYGTSKDKGVVLLRDGEPSVLPPHSFTYHLASQTGGFDPAQAARWGWEADLPLLARYLPAGSSGTALPATGGFWALDQVDVVVAELKRASFGQESEVVLRLQELSGEPTSVVLRSAFPIRRAWMASATEAKLQELEGLN